MRGDRKPEYFSYKLMIIHFMCRQCPHSNHATPAAANIVMKSIDARPCEPTGIPNHSTDAPPRPDSEEAAFEGNALIPAVPVPVVVGLAVDAEATPLGREVVAVAAPVARAVVLLLLLLVVF